MPQKDCLTWWAFISESRGTQFIIPEGGKTQLMASHLQGFTLKSQFSKLENDFLNEVVCCHVAFGNVMVYFQGFEFGFGQVCCTILFVRCFFV